MDPNILKRKRRLKLFILIDKYHAISIHTGSVSERSEGKDGQGYSKMITKESLGLSLHVML